MGGTSPLTKNTPGPSPWYLRLPVAPSVAGFRWSQQDGGISVLEGPNGPVAALSFYNYVQALDSSTLLIRYQEPAAPGSATGPVRLVVIEPSRLAPIIVNPNDLDWRKPESHLRLGGRPLAEVSLATTQIEEDLPLEFPEPLGRIDELLILCDSSAISTSGPNLALLVAQPSTHRYHLYPQDWFNSANLDWGYQWITRIARNPETGRIHGEGIRLPPFVLDETLRGLAEPWKP